MGIKEISKILNNCDEYKHGKYYGIDELREIGIKCVAIDSSIFLYKFGNGYRVLVPAFVSLIMRFIDNDILPICFFDGKKSKLKAGTHEKRRENNRRIEQKIKESIERGDITSVIRHSKSKKNFTSSDISTIQECLGALNIPYFIIDEYESEGLMGYMMRMSYIDAAITEDTDILIYTDIGYWLRDYRDKKFQVIELYELFDQLQISHRSFIDLAIALGTDFNNRILGPKTAYKKIKEYGTLYNIKKYEPEIIKAAKKRRKKNTKSFYGGSYREIRNFISQSYIENTFLKSNPGIEEVIIRVSKCIKSTDSVVISYFNMIDARADIDTLIDKIINYLNDDYARMLVNNYLLIEEPQYGDEFNFEKQLKVVKKRIDNEIKWLCKIALSITNEEGRIINKNYTYEIEECGNQTDSIYDYNKITTNILTETFYSMQYSICECDSENENDSDNELLTTYFHFSLLECEECDYENESDNSDNELLTTYFHSSLLECDSKNESDNSDNELLTTDIHSSLLECELECGLECEVK